MNKRMYYFLCGLAMGAADTVPGISGGTIAFITGIYDNLLQSIKSIDKTFFRLLYRRQWKEAVAKIPWGFVVPLLLGIGIAIFSLANIVVYLMQAHITFVWAFFFGLILASLYLLLKTLLAVKGHTLVSTLCFLVGTMFALWITFSNPISLSHTYPVIFFSGFIAICAMILPGISGAFVLVLLGQYQFILQSLTDLHVPVIVVFALGAISGLLSFAHLVSACLKKYYKQSLAFLSGILAGSLAVLYPFKEGSFSMTTENTLLCGLVFVGIAIPLLLHMVNEKMSAQQKNLS